MATVFRNAMLIVIAGFPGAFVHAFFTGSLLIETIFSLDGLGLLGFESVLNRDYPVVFATLYIFSLVGLAVNLIADLTYTWVDPRIDFETGRSEVDARTKAPETTRRIPGRPRRAAGAPRSAVAAQRRLGEFQAQPRGYWSLWIFLVCSSLAVRGVHRQRQAFYPARRQVYFPRSFTYPRPHSAANSRPRRLSRSYLQKLIARRAAHVWPPIRYSYSTHNLDLPTPARPSRPGC
jgi:hypothetical protein